MTKGTISKVLDYFLSDLKFKKEFLRALGKFLNQPNLSFGDDIVFNDPEDKARFNDWFIFDFRFKNRKTPLKYFYNKNPYNLSLKELEVYKNLLKSKYSVYKAREVKIGHGLKLENLRTGKKYWVNEYKATFQIKKGDILFIRIAKIDDHLELIGSNPYFLPDMDISPLIGHLVADLRLDVKKVKDFFEVMQKAKSKENIEKMKNKLLDGNKCICDICNKKGKLAATSHDKNTGELITICYNCNIRMIAEKDNISIKEAEKRRKRDFETGYLFQDMKTNEYLKLKNKKDFNSMKEANLVLKRIIGVWNDLTIKQRTEFNEFSNKELEKIYKEIEVDFSDL